MDLRGFLDSDQSAERGKEVDDTGGLVLDTSTRDSALPVDDAGDAVPETKSVWSPILMTMFAPVIQKSG